ncbi:F-box only protein 9 isoform X1 [Plutella xylostella]|uniref:F-box only protein 9 isoform X1 n=1 Tax=Plutella xylostella TaxID=51655 RepID=UPI0020327B89|nr:F-box only protein 9 isoform X1 [Plutella xylostella]
MDSSPSQDVARSANGSDNNGDDEESDEPDDEVNPTSTVEEDNEGDALSAFRQQWQRELVTTPSPQKQASQPKEKEETPPPDNDEEKAKKLFLRGIELERYGQLYEAVQHYKRAVQLLPDVEQRLYQSGDHRADTPEVESEAEAEAPRDAAPATDLESDDDDVSGDLAARFQRILARKERFCEPELPQKGVHISWLPHELVLVVLRWVVSSELDAASLERVALACRGLYLAARDPDLWRSLCVRTWGLDCGTPKSLGYPCWRQMYVRRARLLLHGCYISKTTYLRHGENAYQDTFYRPCYLIEYYRYLRFFPEGLVLMWTTADEPAACVGHLKNRATKNNVQGIMSGHYRLIGDKVIVVLKKTCDKKAERLPAAHTRFRTRRRDPPSEPQEQMYHLELQLRAVKSRRNWQLAWRGYSVASRRDQWTAFEIQPAKFPPFSFSRVRNYTADSAAPLY